MARLPLSPLKADIDATGNKIITVGDPTDNKDAANKEYVDTGLAEKADDADTTAALALKADTTTVNAALDLKADKTELATFADDDGSDTPRTLGTITFNAAGDEMTFSDGTNTRTFTGGGSGADIAIGTSLPNVTGAVGDLFILTATDTTLDPDSGPGLYRKISTATTDAAWTLVANIDTDTNTTYTLTEDATEFEADGVTRNPTYQHLELRDDANTVISTIPLGANQLISVDRENGAALIQLARDNGSLTNPVHQLQVEIGETNHGVVEANTDPEFIEWGVVEGGNLALDTQGLNDRFDDTYRKNEIESWVEHDIPVDSKPAIQYYEVLGTPNFDSSAPVGTTDAERVEFSEFKVDLGLARRTGAVSDYHSKAVSFSLNSSQANANAGHWTISAGTQGHIFVIKDDVYKEFRLNDSSFDRSDPLLTSISFDPLSIPGVHDNHLVRVGAQQGLVFTFNLSELNRAPVGEDRVIHATKSYTQFPNEAITAIAPQTHTDGTGANVHTLAFGTSQGHLSYVSQFIGNLADVDDYILDFDTRNPAIPVPFTLRFPAASHATSAYPAQTAKDGVAVRDIKWIGQAAEFIATGDHQASLVNGGVGSGIPNDVLGAPLIAYFRNIQATASLEDGDIYYLTTPFREEFYDNIHGSKTGSTLAEEPLGFEINGQPSDSLPTLDQLFGVAFRSVIPVTIGSDVWIYLFGKRDDHTTGASQFERAFCIKARLTSITTALDDFDIDGSTSPIQENIRWELVNQISELTGWNNGNSLGLPALNNAQSRYEVRGGALANIPTDNLPIVDIFGNNRVVVDLEASATTDVLTDRQDAEDGLTHSTNGWAQTDVIWGGWIGNSEMSDTSDPLQGFETLTIMGQSGNGGTTPLYGISKYVVDLSLVLRPLNGDPTITVGPVRVDDATGQKLVDVALEPLLNAYNSAATTGKVAGETAAISTFDVNYRTAQILFTSDRNFDISVIARDAFQVIDVTNSSKDFTLKYAQRFVAGAGDLEYELRFPRNIRSVTGYPTIADEVTLFEEVGSSVQLDKLDWAISVAAGVDGKLTRLNIRSATDDTVGLPEGTLVQVDYGYISPTFYDFAHEVATTVTIEDQYYPNHSGQFQIPLGMNFADAGALTAYLVSKFTDSLNEKEVEVRQEGNSNVIEFRTNLRGNAEDDLILTDNQKFLITTHNPIDVDNATVEGNLMVPRLFDGRSDFPGKFASTFDFDDAITETDFRSVLHQIFAQTGTATSGFNIPVVTAEGDEVINGVNASVYEDDRLVTESRINQIDAERVILADTDLAQGESLTIPANHWFIVPNSVRYYLMYNHGAEVVIGPAPVGGWDRSQIAYQAESKGLTIINSQDISTYPATYVEPFVVYGKTVYEFNNSLWYRLSSANVEINSDALRTTHLPSAANFAGWFKLTNAEDRIHWDADYPNVVLIAGTNNVDVVNSDYTVPFTIKHGSTWYFEENLWLYEGDSDLTVNTAQLLANHRPQISADDWVRLHNIAWSQHLTYFEGDIVSFTTGAAGSTSTLFYRAKAGIVGHSTNMNPATDTTTWEEYNTAYTIVNVIPTTTGTIGELIRLDTVDGEYGLGTYTRVANTGAKTDFRILAQVVAGNAFPTTARFDGRVFYLETHITIGILDVNPGWYVYRVARAASGDPDTDAYIHAITAGWYEAGETIEASHILPTLAFTIATTPHVEPFEIAAGLWTLNGVNYRYTGAPIDIRNSRDWWLAAPVDNFGVLRTNWERLETFNNRVSNALSRTNTATQTMAGQITFAAGQTFPGAGEDVTATGTWTPAAGFVVSLVGSGTNFQLNFTNTGNLETFLTAAGLSTEAGTQTVEMPAFVFTANGIDYTVAAQEWSYDPSTNFINWPSTTVSPGIPTDNLNLRFTAEFEEDITDLIAGTGLDFAIAGAGTGDLTINTTILDDDNVFAGSNRFLDSVEIREGNNAAAANPLLILNRRSTSPAAGDDLGLVEFKGSTDVSGTVANDFNYGVIGADIIGHDTRTGGIFMKVSDNAEAAASSAGNHFLLAGKTAGGATATFANDVDLDVAGPSRFRTVISSDTGINHSEDNDTGVGFDNNQVQLVAGASIGLAVQTTGTEQEITDGDGVTTTTITGGLDLTNATVTGLNTGNDENILTPIVTLTIKDTGGGADSGAWYFRQNQGTNTVLTPATWADLVEGGTNPTQWHQILFDVFPADDATVLSYQTGKWGGIIPNSQSTVPANSGIVYVRTDDGEAALRVNTSGLATNDYRLWIREVLYSSGVPGTGSNLALFDIPYVQNVGQNIYGDYTFADTLSIADLSNTDNDNRSVAVALNAASTKLAGIDAGSNNVVITGESGINAVTTGPDDDGITNVTLTSTTVVSLGELTLPDTANQVLATGTESTIDTFIAQAAAARYKDGTDTDITNALVGISLGNRPTLITTGGVAGANNVFLSNAGNNATTVWDDVVRLTINETQTGLTQPIRLMLENSLVGDHILIRVDNENWAIYSVTELDTTDTVTRSLGVAIVEPAILNRNGVASPDLADFIGSSRTSYIAPASGDFEIDARTALRYRDGNQDLEATAVFDLISSGLTTSVRADGVRNLEAPGDLNHSSVNTMAYLAIQFRSILTERDFDTNPISDSTAGGGRTYIYIEYRSYYDNALTVFVDRVTTASPVETEIGRTITRRYPAATPAAFFVDNDTTPIVPQD